MRCLKASVFERVSGMVSRITGFISRVSRLPGNIVAILAPTSEKAVLPMNCIHQTSTTGR